MILWDAEGGPRSETQEEWQVRMRQSFQANRRFTLCRVEAVADNRPIDWDDDIPVEWAIELLREWR